MSSIPISERVISLLECKTIEAHHETEFYGIEPNEDLKQVDDANMEAWISHIEGISLVLCRLFYMHEAIGDQREQLF